MNYGNFASGKLNNVNVAYGNIQNNVKFELKYSGNPACNAESAVFNIAAVEDVTPPRVLSISASVKLDEWFFLMRMNRIKTDYYDFF